MADERDAAPGATLHVDLAWQSVVVGIVSLLTLALLWSAVRMASTSFAIIVVALFLGMALDPVVNLSLIHI